MTSKLYTLEEANALLPYLAPTLVELREKSEQAAQIRNNVTQAAATNGGSEKRERWSRTLERVGELIERVQEWELQLRDIGTGLVDFPALVQGEEAWLCWRLGEPEVAYWHPKDAGISERKPL